jgi:hypothetical protein
VATGQAALGRSDVMRRMRWTTYMWPGFPQLWLYGTWSGLALSLGTAAVLDLLLVISFGWTELVSPTVRTMLWVGFGVFWLTAVLRSIRQCTQLALERQVNPEQDAFGEALDHYLKGDYYQAEHVLVGLLERNLRDVEARLMLATLFRHTGRTEEATRELDTLAHFEDAAKWELEIANERALLAEKNSERTPETISAA